MRAVENNILRADLVALAKVQADFDHWCEDRTAELCERYTELFHEQKDEVEFALRQIKRCPELYSEKDKNLWQQQNTKINVELFSLSYEIGLLLQADLYLPFLLRRWRESQNKK